MKRIFAILLLCAALCACTAQSVSSSVFTGALPASGSTQTPSDVSVYAPGVTGDPDMVTTEVVTENITAQTQSIAVRWTNNSEGELAFGVSFHLERLNGDEWEVVPYKDENTAFISIAWLLPAGESVEHSYDLTWYDADELTPGTYRWVDGFHNPHNPHRHMAEFVITK